MKEMKTQIELSGILGKIFGTSHERIITTVGESIQALCCTIEGFEKFLSNSKEKGLTFAVFKGKKNIGKDDLGFPVSGEVIRIVPVVIGSKKAGILQTILGAALVVAGVLVTGLSYGWAAPVGQAMIGAGIGMGLGGVVQMLSPQPGGLARKESPDNKASYAFGGVTNTASQG
ncbi:TPA: tail assembly protein, partial [Klebsiella aerogenes]|nr:tail assembly protein [Klebsiella aerogenes]